MILQVLLGHLCAYKTRERTGTMPRRVFIECLPGFGILLACPTLTNTSSGDYSVWKSSTTQLTKSVRVENPNCWSHGLHVAAQALTILWFQEAVVSVFTGGRKCTGTQEHTELSISTCLPIEQRRKPLCLGFLILFCLCASLPHIFRGHKFGLRRAPPY